MKSSILVFTVESKRTHFSAMNLLVLPKAIVAFCVFLCLCLLGSVETFTTTVSSSPDSLLVAEVFQRYSYLPEGKHINERVSIDVVVKEIKQISPHLVFMRAYDHEDGIIELLLRERDSFLTTDEIERIKFAASQPGSRLHCCGFPESLGAFDGPTFFPDLEARPTEPVCLHLVAANVSLANGKVLEICPQERPQIIDSMPGRMPPVRGGCKSGNRGGGGNRDRGGIFAAWAVERFQLKPGIARILDVAGGSGQLAFQLGVRRGYNVTVVDPRALRLAPDQQRTLHYHRKTRLRLLPGERNPSLPVSDYGHHFCELPVHSLSDRTFLVSGNAQVKHLQTYFDPDFVTTRAWESCSAVLGMHPDEATEDLVDLALKHNKPFAVVPCCVFWKQDPHRKTPSGKQVRKWEHFCEYLIAKDKRIQVDSLPFPGRNVVLYSTGGTGDGNTQ